MGKLMRTWNRHALAAGAIILLAILALVPLAREGIVFSDDILDSIYRVFSLQASWEAGVFYPRLSPDLAYGYSVPLVRFIQFPWRMRTIGFSSTCGTQATNR